MQSGRLRAASRDRILGPVRFLKGSIVRNSNWLIFGGFSGAAISFVVSAWVARYFSMSDFGMMQLAFSSFAFAQFGENLVYPTIFKKLVIESPEDRERLYRASQQIIGIYGAAVVAVSIAAYFITHDQLFFYLSVLSCGILFRVANGVSFYYDATLQSRKTQRFQLSALALSGAFRAVAAVLSPLVWLQMLGYVLNYVVSSVLHFISEPVARTALKNFFVVDSVTAKRLMQASFGFLLVGACNLFLYRVDVLILGALTAPATVAIYSVAVKLSEPWLFVGAAISSSFLAVLVKARSESYRRYYLSIAQLFWILVSISLVISTLVFLFASPIVHLTFGEKYLDSVAILRVHAWTIGFLFLYYLHHIWDVCEGLTTWAITRSVISALVNVVLNFIFIPRYGAIACAWSSVATYFCYGYGLNLLHPKGRFLIKQEFKLFVPALRGIRARLSA